MQLDNLKPGEGFELAFSIHEFGVRIEQVAVYGVYPILFDQSVTLGLDSQLKSSQTKHKFTTALEFASGVKF